jgi:hypothetical protein
MKKIRSPLSALILLGLSLLSACHHRPEGPHPVPPSLSTFKIWFNGPFAIVVLKSRIIVFSPRDPDGLHGFYVNSLDDNQDSTKNYHFKLEQEGFKTVSATEIDHELADFTARTDLWKREEYFFIGEFPKPYKITFAPPQHQITFANGSTGYMATNFVLEYEVTDREKIKAISPELGVLKPLTGAELRAQYARLCSKAGVKELHHDSCIGVRNLLEQCVGEQTSVLFFGVGTQLATAPPGSMEDFKASDHAVRFFNNVLLPSFPDLRYLRLAPPREPDKLVPSVGNGLLSSVSFSVPVSRIRALPVSAVIDCKAGGLIAITTQ